MLIVLLPVGQLQGLQCILQKIKVRQANRHTPLHPSHLTTSLLNHLCIIPAVKSCGREGNNRGSSSNASLNRKVGVKAFARTFSWFLMASTSCSSQVSLCLRMNSSPMAKETSIFVLASSQPLWLWLWTKSTHGLKDNRQSAPLTTLTSLHAHCFLWRGSKCLSTARILSLGLSEPTTTCQDSMPGKRFLHDQHICSRYCIGQALVSADTG